MLLLFFFYDIIMDVLVGMGWALPSQYVVGVEGTILIIRHIMTQR
jgi:hypothetical protein